MKTWHVYTLETGRFTGQSFTGDADDIAANMPDGCEVVADVSDWQSQCVEMTGRTVIDYQPPAPPSDEMQAWHWDIEVRRWVSAPTLAAIKTAAWASIKAERDRRLSAGFTVAGRHYQVNQAAMSGATLGAFMALVQGGATAADYRQAWVLSNNTVVTLTAAEMIAVGRVCKTVVSNLWATSQYLRGLIDAIDDETGTLQDVAAVVWPE